MEKKELLNLINNSFLSQEKKNSLIQYLNEKGEGEEFYNLFNQYLIEEVKKREKDYKETLDKLDQAIFELDKEFDEKKAKAEKEMEEKLSKTDPLDLFAKGKILDEYTEFLENLTEEYEKRLKEISSKLIISSI